MMNFIHRDQRLKLKQSPLYQGKWSQELQDFDSFFMFVPFTFFLPSYRLIDVLVKIRHEVEGGDMLRPVDDVVGHDGGQVFGEGGGEMIRLLENLELFKCSTILNHCQSELIWIFNWFKWIGST